jgi:hypothetical protein
MSEQCIILLNDFGALCAVSFTHLSSSGAPRMNYQPEQEFSRIRMRLARWREILFSQKYRFDLGQSFLVILNFTLLIITASDKLMIFFGIPRLRELLVVIIPMGFLGVWLFGFFMDKIVRAGQMAERQSVRRSEVWQHHHEQMDRVEQQLAELRHLIRESKE